MFSGFALPGESFRVALGALGYQSAVLESLELIAILLEQAPCFRSAFSVVLTHISLYFSDVSRAV